MLHTHKRGHVESFRGIDSMCDTIQDGTTALTSAAGNGHADVVKALIEAGADLSVENEVR